MLIGVGFALAAGLMWGLVFLAPVVLPAYPPAVLTASRYFAFGLVALGLAWFMRHTLRGLSRADWVEATKLTLAGNFFYYLFLSAAIQRTGGPLSAMIIGTLPVVIAICANIRDHERDGWLPWSRLAVPLGLMALGIACVNQTELARLREDAHPDVWRYASGAALAVVAVGFWTWYPIRNADWLRTHPDRSPMVWATAQGLVTLPIAALGLLGLWAYALLNPSATASYPLPFGPDPLPFVGMMLTLGLFASWIGTLCWNQASQRLPTSLAGQLIVFETLAALAYGFAWRGEWPGWVSAAGIALLVAGVVMALRIQPVKTAAAGPRAS